MNSKEYKGAGIYQFTCNITGMKYVGSSKQCKKRYTNHVCPSSKEGSKNIIVGGDFEFDILEYLPLDVSDELLADREQYWMDQVTSEVLVNIYRAKGLGHKEYRAANKDKIAARKAAHYAANREKRLAQMAAHYAANREKRIAQMAAYRAARRVANKLLKTDAE